MSDPVNMVQLVRDLPSRPRGRACVVLTHDYFGQKEWAEDLARKTGSEHLNLLELFADDKALGSRVGQFLVPELFKLLEGRSKATVLIITGLEFLKATWSGQATMMDEFARQIETWHKDPCLLFCLQYDKNLATYKFKRFGQYRFVVDQKETLAL